MNIPMSIQLRLINHQKRSLCQHLLVMDAGVSNFVLKISAAAKATGKG